jgi:branched-chain amino acid transport system substrate-binding protein
MKRWRISLWLAAAFLLAYLTVASGEEIVIGFSGPLSGPAAQYGQDCLYGLDMAAREINTAGGVSIQGKKYFFTIEKLNDRADPTQAKNNALRLVHRHRALAVFNPVSTTLFAIMGIPQTRGREFIIGAYTSIHAVMEKKHPMIINAVSDFTAYAENMAAQGRANGWKKLAMVATSGTYGEAWRKTFADVWIARGGQVVGDYPVNYYTETDFSVPLAAALAKKPEVLLIGGPSATTALVVRQARERGFRGGFILIDQAKPDYVAKMLGDMKLLEGMISTGDIGAVPVPAMPAFKERFYAAYKRDITAECVLHYTILKVIAKTIQITGSVRPAEIRANLHQALPVAGDEFPAELFGIEDNGDLLCGLVMQTVREGKFSKVDYIFSFPKTKEDFEKYKKMSKTAEPEMIRWAPVDRLDN